VRDTQLDLAFAGPAIGVILFVLWANIIIAAMSNGANLTDGLDGLATGASTMIFGAYVLIGIWQFNQNCQTNPGLKCYEVRDSLDLAIVAACGMGACFGFLWWNASPAKIFMGDTGSLGLGGAIAGLAILTRTELLSVILAGLFVSRRSPSSSRSSVFKTTRQTGLPDGAPAPPLRDARLGADHRRHPVLDHRRALRRARLGIFYAEWVVGST
jgi:phospho-N-acetylmuramoyl-pentapeptide-transferase